MHNCEKWIKINLHSKKFRHVCNGVATNNNIFEGTFLKHVHLKMSELLHFAYLWLANVPQTSIELVTGHSSTTVPPYTRHFNQLVASDIESNSFVIGGEGNIFEVDECKMGNSLM
jgi:hypothetical protein